ncbi:MAG TPA: diacylglycerol kinase family protein [Candidatus Dormibacteraeota bacterium]|nr:diacylglycerol kinase family protein [Candidatus Dormibacteraeota bacterium]
MAPGAGAVTPEVEARLREAFPDHAPVELDPHVDVAEQVGDAARVVVAGGDGTIGLVLRALAGGDRRVGLLPLGTFNNFATALGIEGDLERAIEVVKTGRPRPITLGRVDGRPFLELAAVGAFGELIALGEAAKELAFGELARVLGELRDLRQFRYRLDGDVRRSGRALSLVAANTPTTGARLPVGDKTPDQPYLELAFSAAARLFRRAPRNAPFRTLTVRTDPPVPVYADNAEVGLTPVVIEAWPGAVTVIEPA